MSDYCANPKLSLEHPPVLIMNAKAALDAFEDEYN